MRDLYRKFYPEEKDCFTYWSARFQCKAKNKGWRLDYNIVSKELEGMAVDVIRMKDQEGSDHCPLIAEFEETLLR
jgi:exodeoxyribonuclease-3